MRTFHSQSRKPDENINPVNVPKSEDPDLSDNLHKDPKEHNTVQQKSEGLLRHELSDESKGEVLVLPGDDGPKKSKKERLAETMAAWMLDVTPGDPLESEQDPTLESLPPLPPPPPPPPPPPSPPSPPPSSPPSPPPSSPSSLPPSSLSSSSSSSFSSSSSSPPSSSIGGSSRSSYSPFYQYHLSQKGSTESYTSSESAESSSSTLVDSKERAKSKIHLPPSTTKNIVKDVHPSGIAGAQKPEQVLSRLNEPAGGWNAQDEQKPATDRKQGVSASYGFKESRSV
ncbi:hypothetical protein BASA62_010514 [Batrachochytrium salamandrivorans]|nr:hypothetical protein BASA62_010514 [Batrachochytrium salamandrivorans]